MRIYSHLCCQLLQLIRLFTTCYTNSADRQLCIGLTRIKSYLLLRISLPVHNGILTDFCIHTIVLCNQIYRYRISIHRNFLDIAARRGICLKLRLVRCIKNNKAIHRKCRVSGCIRDHISSIRLSIYEILTYEAKRTQILVVAFFDLKGLATL